jgi:hypothetical protein
MRCRGFAMFTDRMFTNPHQGASVDALDRCQIRGGAGAELQPCQGNTQVARLFSGIRTAREYDALLETMTKPRIRASEAFAGHWAQRAVRRGEPDELRPALLAASVRGPVERGWDDATYPLAVVIRASQVRGWDTLCLLDGVRHVLDDSRVQRVLRMARYETPVLDVAGLTESGDLEHWEVR